MNTFGEFKTFCREHSPEEVAKSLAKVFKVGKLSEKNSQKASEIHRNLNSANLTLFRAENGASTSANQVIADRAKQRIADLKQELVDLHNKQAETEKAILKDDTLTYFT